LLISICIPAYNRTNFLVRLLDSIVIQTFKDFEVVVTDDSPNEDVKSICLQYQSEIPLHYHKNPVQLGTPENWNESIRKAKGEWIKIMHDDDWFSTENSLAEYVKAINHNPSAQFFFSAYQNIYEQSNREQNVHISASGLRRITNNPVTLFASNLVGPPSVTLHKNSQQFWYDRKIKWVVDIDFYIRYFKETVPVFIPKTLINVGLHQDQVTTSAFRVNQIEIPENFYLLDKVGDQQLKNVRVYDAWWRLMRNLKIKDEEAIRKNGYPGNIPVAIISMIHWQRNFPQALLNFGLFSKLTMFANYLRNYPRIR